MMREFSDNYSTPNFEGVDTQDRSGLLDKIEAATEYVKKASPQEIRDRLVNALRKSHHGQDCIICFERFCVCTPR